MMPNTPQEPDKFEFQVLKDGLLYIEEEESITAASTEKDGEEPFYIEEDEEEHSEKHDYIHFCFSKKHFAYTLGWGRRGFIRPKEGECDGCKKDTIVLAFGEDEYGDGHICKACALDLFAQLEPK